MTYLIYDLIMIAVLALLILRGRERGFILTLCGLAAVFVAYIGAMVLSDLLTAPVARVIEPFVAQHIQTVLDSAVSAGSSAPVAELSELFRSSSVFQSLAEAFQRAMGQGYGAASSALVPALSGYAAREIARSALFFISFVVVLAAWTLLAHTLDLVAKLPVLSDVNRLLGGVFGFLEGAALLFIAAWLLRGRLIPQSAVEQTVLLKFFCEHDPLSLLPMLYFSKNS